MGDVAGVGVPKAGTFAEGRASIAAEGISARIRAEGESPRYDGRGTCFVDLGSDGVAKVAVTFGGGEIPHGAFQGPSHELAAENGRVRLGSHPTLVWPQLAMSPGCVGG